MKKISLKIAAALLGAAFGNLSAANAATQDQSLGGGSGLVDRYRVTCSTANGADTAQLATRVKNNTPSSPSLSVQAYKGSVATNSTDAVSGDAVFSPLSYVARGNGVYFIAVDKAGAGAVAYTLYYQCETTQGVATGTAISIRQDQ
ncbi:hypothetical protein [Methylomicrobium lacus]|uniref:hypothetical protein n=1 Tax=Methylomicrobium lacus TaxID=136992 RepID=UPI0035A8D592